MFSQEPNGKWADGPSDSLCVGLKGEELECSKKESETWGGGWGERQEWLPGGEAFRNWQGSPGALPRDGRRQEGGNWVQVTTEQQLGQGVGEAGLAGAWAATPQLGLEGWGLLPLPRPWESSILSGHRPGRRA